MDDKGKWTNLRSFQHFGRLLAAPVMSSTSDEVIPQYNAKIIALSCTIASVSDVTCDLPVVISGYSVYVVVHSSHSQCRSCRNVYVFAVYRKPTAVLSHYSTKLLRTLVVGRTQSSSGDRTFAAGSGTVC